MISSYTFIQNSYTMYTIQLRNLSEEVYEGIKKAAEESRRSMTQEVIFAIQSHLENRNIRRDIAKRRQLAMRDIEELNKLSPLKSTAIIENWAKSDQM